MFRFELFLIVQTIIGISLALPQGAPLLDNGSGFVEQDQDPDGQESSKSMSTLGSMYRAARQSRCVKCFHYYDERYPAPDYRPAYPSGMNYPSSPARTGYEDRSWYHYPDDRRYEQRNYERYDDRYPARTYDRYDVRQGYYDRYDVRPPSEYRGNGYDSRDRYHDNQRYSEGYYGDRYYERPRPAYEGRNDYYDRYGGRYDNRNFRPWDETYRGISGFDNSGRGYWFASSPESDTRPSSSSYYRPGGRPPPPPLPPQGYDERPLEYGSRHPQPPPKPISPPNSSSQPSQPSSGSSSQQSSQGSSSPNNNYDNRQPIQPSDNDAKGSYAGTWAYDNNRNMDRRPNYESRDNDIQSTGYGTRRPYGGSYLHDRENNVPVEIKDDKDMNGAPAMDNSNKDSDSSNPSKAIESNDKH